MNILSNKKGQAMVEYMFLILFLIVLSSKLITGFGDFMRNSVGNLGYALTMNLTTGVCEDQCFFSGYRNGPQ